MLLRTEPDDGWRKNWSLGRVLRIISARRTVDVVWLKPERGANLGRDRCAPYQTNCAARARPGRKSMKHMFWLLTSSRARSTRCPTKQKWFESRLLRRSLRQWWPITVAICRIFSQKWVPWTFQPDKHTPAIEWSSKGLSMSSVQYGIWFPSDGRFPSEDQVTLAAEVARLEELADQEKEKKSYKALRKNTSPIHVQKTV